MKQKTTCERCLGVVTKPRRGVSLEESMTNHQTACPSVTTRKKEA